MIPSSQKVDKSLFKSLLAGSRSIHSDTFSLRVVFLPTLSPAKFSVVVAKKLEKSAVKRNVIKRRMYASLSGFLGAAKPGAVCVFFLKKKVEKPFLGTLSEEIEKTLRVAKVL